MPKKAVVSASCCMYYSTALSKKEEVFAIIAILVIYDVFSLLFLAKYTKTSPHPEAGKSVSENDLAVHKGDAQVFDLLFVERIACQHQSAQGKEIHQRQLGAYIIIRQIQRFEIDELCKRRSACRSASY